MFVSVGVQVRWTVCDAHGCISVVWMNPWYSSEDLVVQRSKVANLYVKASQWYVSRCFGDCITPLVVHSALWLHERQN